jgi:hypothetical protein
MRSPRTDTIRASEIGAYLFCRRAWWYRRTGVKPQNQAELVAGTRLHTRHGRTVFSAGLYRWAGYAVLLAALTLLAVSIANYLI